MANLGVLSSALGKKAIIFSDKKNHLSIYDACRISGLKYFRYRHNDMNHLAFLLKQCGQDDEKWIVIVGTFGVTGEIPNLVEIVRLARKYKAKIYLDDAHAIGIFGENKQGLADHYGILEEIDLIMGSFQMSFGNIGAFVAGNQALVDLIWVHARPYIFSYGLPAANVVAILKGLSILKSAEGDKLIKNLWDNVNFLREGLADQGIPVISKDTQIVSFEIGDEKQTLDFSNRLFEKGLWVQTYLHPSVEQNRGIMRMTCMASHTRQHLSKALEAICEVRREFQMING